MPTVEQQPPTPQPPDIAEKIRGFLQGLLNDTPAEEMPGAAIVGNFLVVVECHNGESSFLRVIDPDLPYWTKLGFLGFLGADIQAEMSGNYGWAAARAYENREDDSES